MSGESELHRFPTIAGSEVLGRAEDVIEDVMRRDLWSHLDPGEVGVMLDVLDRVQAEIGLPGGGVMPP